MSFDAEKSVEARIEAKFDEIIENFRWLELHQFYKNWAEK